VILWRVLRQARIRIEVWPDRLRVVNFRGKPRALTRSEVIRYAMGRNRTWWWVEQGYAVLRGGEQVPLDAVRRAGGHSRAGSDRAEHVLAFLKGHGDTFPGPGHALRLRDRVLLALCSLGFGCGLLLVTGGVDVLLRQPGGPGPSGVIEYAAFWLLLVASAFGIWRLVKKGKKAQGFPGRRTP
jgi:hypothetical protein